MGRNMSGCWPGGRGSRRNDRGRPGGLKDSGVSRVDAEGKREAHVPRLAAG